MEYYQDNSNLTDLEKKACEIAGVENWYAWIFEFADGGTICTGAVCPLKQSGPNAGQPNFRKADKSTKKKVVIPAGYHLKSMVD